MRADTAIYTAFDDLETRHDGAPERTLMYAILRTAMEDIHKSGEPYREARQYLLNNDESYLFSFLSICNHLQLCPRSIRRASGLVVEPLRERLAA